MRRIIIAAILTVICAVGAGTSFAVNDLPNFGEWMKTNEQQFRKPHKHDGPNKHMDKHMDKPMMDGKGQQAPQDSQGSNPGQNMPPNRQVPPQNQNGQMPPQGQPPQGQPPQGGQPNGNAPQQAPNSETQAQ